jgi:hypothetical protein
MDSVCTNDDLLVYFIAEAGWNAGRVGVAAAREASTLVGAAVAGAALALKV